MFFGVFLQFVPDIAKVVLSKGQWYSAFEILDVEARDRGIVEQWVVSAVRWTSCALVVGTEEFLLTGFFLEPGLAPVLSACLPSSLCIPMQPAAVARLIDIRPDMEGCPRRQLQDITISLYSDMIDAIQRGGKESGP
jgi:hypothetical protein